MPPLLWLLTTHRNSFKGSLVCWEVASSNCSQALCVQSLSPLSLSVSPAALRFTTGCPTPEEVAAEIGKHVRSTQSLPSRHVMRIIPISQTCFVSEDDVRVLAAKLAELHFPKGG